MEYWEEKHPNGQIKLCGYYLDGEKHGSWLEYNEDGDLVLVMVFEHGRQL